MIVAMGQYDAPQIQKQPILMLDLHKSNIAVLGAPMTGKTTFIKTMLVRLHENMKQCPAEHIYLIDFGGNIGTYGKLRNVCACFDNSNEENIKRIFRTIEKRLAENAKVLESRNYYTVASRNPEAAPPHIFLIIENINAFLADERYASYQDLLIRFCRDGLSKGLTVVITGNELAGTSRLLANFGLKIAFEMSGDSYTEIFNTRVNKPMRLPGRGLVNLKSEVYEFQCFMPFQTEDDEDAIRQLVKETEKYPNDRAMVSFGDILNWENLPDYCTGTLPEPGRGIVVGLDYFEHKPVSVNISESRAIAIYGKRRFGKTNLLKLLLKGIHEQHPDARFIYFDDGRKQLEPFYREGENHISDYAEYLTDAGEMRDYLAQNGYGGKGTDGKTKEPGQTPFTVFVMQSKVLFRGAQDGKYLMTRFPMMAAEAETRGYLFIFTDVGNITDPDIRRFLNDSITTAFLLGDIGEFVSQKGDKTAFGDMDARELKAEYAKCSLGDGYMYDTVEDKLVKLKYIKAYEEA